MPAARAARRAFVLAAVTLVCLLPFLGKPVHMDDPIFLWPAQRIAAGDARPFDVPVNWYGFTEPLSRVTKNPPAVSYVLAGIGRVAGWSEFALHAGMLIFAVGAAIGTFCVARQLAADGLAAGLLMLATPAFFVSATTLMSDVPMLCFWTWAVAAWLWARDADRPWGFLLAGLLAGLAGACKYPGLFVVPLLALCVSRRRWPWQVAGLILPVALLVLVDVGGESLGLTAAVAYAAERFRRAGELPAQLVTGLSYLGGALLPVGVMLLLSARRRELIWIVILAAIVAVAVRVWPAGLIPLQSSAGAHRAVIEAHAIVFALAGIAVLVATVATVWRDRSRGAVLLAAWMGGIFIFATLLNWTTNARSLLALAPAVAILAGRRVSSNSGAIWKDWRVAVPIAAGLALSAGIGLADYRWAAASRDAADTFFKRSREIHRTKWFVGHWGFQWYMQKGGAVPVDYDASTLAGGDLLVWPANNTNLLPMPPGTLVVIDTIERPTLGWLSTIDTSRGTNFFTSQVGPLPWCVGGAGSERFIVYRVTRPILPPKRPAE